jgi:LPXTG-motif cell wall-anchored protein
MRNRLLGALAAGSILLVPTAALAQVEDPCYVDPHAPECIDVGVDDGEADDGTVDVDDGTEVREDVVTRTAAPTQTTGVLARTGLETGTLVAIFVGLLAAGGALLFTTRRRSTS